MRLDAKEVIGGFPILAVRNALRRCIWGFDGQDLTRLLKSQPDAVRDLINELEKREWCEANVRGGWEMTSNGMTFLSASAGHPISRAKANAHLHVIIERAAEFRNAFPDWPLRLERIAVFGSYLTDAEKLGDLDVAVKLERVPELMNPESIHLALASAEERGYRATSSLDRAGGFLTFFIRKELTNGLRSVSVHDWSDIDALDCAYEVVWTG